MENLITDKKPILVTMDVESLYPSIPQDELLKTVYGSFHMKSTTLGK